MPSPVVESVPKITCPDGSPPIGAPDSAIRRRPQQLDSLLRESALEPEIRHHRSHDPRRIQTSGLPLRPGRDPEHVVAVDDPAVVRAEDGAVGVAVERGAELCAAGRDPGGEPFGMDGAAAGVDVSPVRAIGERDDVDARPAKGLRREAPGGAVGAVDRGAHSRSAAGHAPFQSSQIDLGQLRVFRRSPRRPDRRRKAGLAEAALEISFRLVGPLSAVRPEDLDAVVRPGIVRSRDRNARVRLPFANELGHGGRGHGAGIFDVGERAQPLREIRQDLRGGFPGVAAHDHPGTPRPANKRGTEQKADPVHGIAVERIFSGGPPQAVRAEDAHAGGLR
jgi:hypothetical protein